MLLLLLVLALFGARADDPSIAMCGGFVKPSTKALAKAGESYAEVKVRLITNDGLFKSESDCSPKGYHFTPIYDQGEYKLIVQGPDGWSFVPQERRVKVLEDGTNTCSEDMDFLLVGFRVSGVLTLPTGCQAPPSSLTLNLLDANSSMVVASSTVTTSGEYAFVGVSPGLYVLSPSGGGLFPSNTVEVVWGPVTVPPLQIPGFQLTGSVVGYHSEPLVGIAVHLIGKANPAPCAALQPPRDPSKHSCTDVTDSTGSFAFHSLSCDPFTLTAELTSVRSNLTFLPVFVPITLPSASVNLQASPFRLDTFTISGVVRDFAGAGVSRVNISVNSEVVAVTGQGGRYYIPGIRPGTVTIIATSTTMKFSALAGVEVTPSSSVLPDIVAVSYSLCGAVLLGGFPGRTSLTHTIQLSQLGLPSTGLDLQTSTDEEGSYCFFVPPGRYQLTALVPEDEAAAGLVLTPSPLFAIVEKAPIPNADFKATSLTVHGRVSCFSSPCPSDLRVVAVSASTAKPASSVAVAPNSRYMLSGLWPGTYNVSVVSDSSCWGEPLGQMLVDGRGSSSVQVTVVASDVIFETVLEQSGWVATFATPLPFSVRVAPVGDSLSSHGTTLRLPSGPSRWCLGNDTLTVTPDTCFQFSQDVFQWSPSSPLVVMQPLRQLVFGQIHVEHGTDVVPSLIFIRSEDSSGQVRKVHVFRLSPTQLGYRLVVTGNTTVTLTPVNADPAVLRVSKALPFLFYPNSTTVLIPPQTCPPFPTVFRAVPGRSITGQVTPKLEGVLVTATVDGDVPVDLTGVLPGEITATSLTSAGGTFTLQPLHPDVRYNFAAEKDGFHFKRVLDSAIAELEFIHQRLGSASVTVMDKAGAALPGVVLSFSGDAYRHNGLSNATGVFVAPNLFPGRYFLRPMLKEYSFLPSSLDVEILEGHNTEVLISATRVAYSVFGCVTSVNGNPVGNVTITAVGTGIAAEKAITDSATGIYRVRGLAFGTEYELRVLSPSSLAPAAYPLFHRLAMPQQDVYSADFVVHKPFGGGTISGVVELPGSSVHVIPSLFLRVTPASSSTGSSHSQSLPFTRYFEFSSLPAGAYTVSVSPTSVGKLSVYVEPVVVSVVDGERVHVTLSVSVSEAPTEEVTVSSFPAVFVAVSVILLYFNYEQVLANLDRVWQKVYRVFLSTK